MGNQGGDGANDASGGEQGAKGTARGSSTARRVPFKKGRNGVTALPIAPEVKHKAKQLYMQYLPLAEIAAATGVIQDTLKSWIKREKWLDTREGINRELAKEINRRRAFTWSKIVNQSTEIIAKYVVDLARQPVVDGKDALQVANILGQLDKAMRLAQGEPTDVVKHEGTVGLQALAFKTKKEIKDAIAADPMTVDVLPDEGAVNSGAKPGQVALDALESEAQASVRADLLKASISDDPMQPAGTPLGDEENGL